MPTKAEQLARIQQAHHRRLLAVQNTTGDLVGEAWDTFADLDDVSAAEFASAADVIVETGKRQTSTLAVAYMNANDRAAGFPDANLLPTLPTIRGGTPATEVYQRSIVTARALVAKGSPVDQAKAAGRARAVGTAQTDISLANKAEIERGGTQRPWVVGYRRVLTGKSCAFCASASTQRYRSARLLPIHPRCDCDVAEIYGTADPGRVINQQLLDDLKAAAKADNLDKYWEGPYTVDADGSIHYRKFEPVKDDAGRKLLGPDGKPMRRTVQGDPIKVRTVDHPEMGPTLQDARRPKPGAPELATPRRTKVSIDDPDVIREAQRRNVSRERVIELREEKAERRFLEDRARREAAKTLSADDPVVVNAARRFGVHPDEVLTARARVADVRKAAREEAARIQADALNDLDRFDILRLRPPPRKGARTGMGAQARGGEYDWLEALDERELGRLSRRWYDEAGGLSPDQIAQKLNERGIGGGDVSVDQAMDIWLRLTRTEEAAGALRRGKLPSSRAYSGQLDPTRLLPDLERDGYDVEILFGDDINAAAHLAEVEHKLVADEAIEYLGDAARAAPGSRPYEMSFQAWETEVRDLEEAIRENFASVNDRRRYGELVPQWIDEPGLDFEELYARIVSTARKAGEEVPDHASIPWQ